MVLFQLFSFNLLNGVWNVEICKERVERKGTKRIAIFYIHLNFLLLLSYVEIMSWSEGFDIKNSIPKDFAVD